MSLQAATWTLGVFGLLVMVAGAFILIRELRILDSNSPQSRRRRRKPPNDDTEPQ